MLPVGTVTGVLAKIRGPDCMMRHQEELAYRVKRYDMTERRRHQRLRGRYSFARRGRMVPVGAVHGVIVKIRGPYQMMRNQEELSCQVVCYDITERRRH